MQIGNDQRREYTDDRDSHDHERNRRGRQPDPSGSTSRTPLQHFRRGDQGISKSTGTKLISASGHINKPGVYEIELGLPVEEFIYSDEYCGGIINGRKLKAVVAGGSSVPILPAELILKNDKGEARLMSYESLSEGGFATGTMMGSGGFIVLDEDQCIVKHTYTLARFYRHESCGQCSPCREGIR